MALLPEVLFGLQIILGIWILAAGILKILDLYGIIRIFKELKLLPQSIAGKAGVLYAFAELCIGAALLLSTFIYAALVLLLVKQTLSVAGVFMLLLEKKKISNCGCYGTFIRTPLTWWRLVDNLIIIGLAIIVLA